MTINRTHWMAAAGLLCIVLSAALIGCDARHMAQHAGAEAGRVDAVRLAAPTTAVPRRPVPAEAVGRAHDARPVTGLSPEDELWIIARPAGGAAPAGETTAPGCGSLVSRGTDGGQDVEVPLPLEHTEVAASISGYIASVNVRQRFYNPYDGKIEAVYVFPLPQNAAVSDFVMTIGERRIRGIIREREEAEQIYADARRQGYTASLLTQERPNIFTQRVANIEPGRRIDVDLTYFSTLTYSDGWYAFVFPMVVGPRFNPPGSTGGIGAVPRGAPGSSGQGTEVPYLAPNERSGHDIALSVEIDAGVPIEESVSVNHLVEVTAQSSSRMNVALSPRDSVPNKDFLLMYRVAGEELRASMLTHRDERGGYFTLMVYPPRDIGRVERAPIEMVFVVDCSGSMRGEPIAKAKRAIDRALLQLRPGDSFQVIRFSNDSSTLGPDPLPVTAENVRKGRRYVRSLEPGGGTMMVRGIRAALDFPHDPERTRYVTFMTDGFIGNEADVLREVTARLGDTRIFSFGVGSAPNRHLLERLAKLGRGVVAYVGLNDDPNEVMDLFIERVSHPAMTGLSVDFGGMQVDDLRPGRLPDLFVGRPVILTGRFRGPEAGSVRVSGRVGDRIVEIPVTSETATDPVAHGALPKVWARMTIADLADRAVAAPDPRIGDRIRDLALEYGLMSAYTAFVAVDSSRRTEGDSGTTVPVPVPVPDGVRYDTTVSSNSK